MLQRVALHLDEQHSKTVNVDDVYHTAKLLSPLMATYDELTANPHWPLACCCNQNVCVYPQLHPQSEWMRLGYAARSGSSKEKLPPLFQNGFQYECHLWTPSVYDVSRFSCFIKKRSVLSLVVKKNHSSSWHSRYPWRYLRLLLVIQKERETFISMLKATEIHHVTHAVLFAHILYCVCWLVKFTSLILCQAQYIYLIIHPSGFTNPLTVYKGSICMDFSP